MVSPHCNCNINHVMIKRALEFVNSMTIFLKCAVFALRIRHFLQSSRSVFHKTADNWVMYFVMVLQRSVCLQMRHSSVRVP